MVVAGALLRSVFSPQVHADSKATPKGKQRNGPTVSPKFELLITWKQPNLVSATGCHAKLRQKRCGYTAAEP